MRIQKSESLGMYLMITMIQSQPIMFTYYKNQQNSSRSLLGFVMEHKEQMGQGINSVKLK